MNVTAYHLAAYGAGLAMTLVLASYLTPRNWWRRPTVRGLAILVGGAWAFGALLMHAIGTPLPGSTLAGAAPLSVGVPDARAAAGTQALAAAWSGDDIPGQPFRVHRALNLRADPSTSAERLGTVPAGAMVTPTGKRRGDWWQVKAETDGREQTGWASSLWLRRKYE